ncbi:hypothetical protein CYFUS_002169 [Cystobacter fuscus]|uniref:Uncharacterized protein n=1 Tax=Cystobacter fuscus TaxID=43 RepID=A0A250IYE6_9BACT|nr:hypothetical protein [Cystobacter fuscus]ATB36754.1 hypothetical protein CYFUS_002169 [Cystobacter fuscus]
MSDTSDWKGRRLGPYQVGDRYPEIPEDEGRLYEAHHVETGEPALVMMPGTGDDWRTSAPWSAQTTSFTGPDALVVHPKRSAGAKLPTFHEMTLGFIRLAGILAQLDGREDVRAHFAREPRSTSSRRKAQRWGLAGAGLALAVGLALLLWPRGTPHLRTGNTSVESIFFSDDQDTLAFPAIAYPMPETAFKEQRKPPCIPEAQVEIRGGCWNELAKTAPCPRSTAEYQGRCYVPVKKPDPQPSSVQP